MSLDPDSSEVLEIEESGRQKPPGRPYVVMSDQEAEARRLCMHCKSAQRRQPKSGETAEMERMRRKTLYCKRCIKHFL